MAFLKNLLKQLLSDDSKPVEEAVDHFAELEKLRIAHEWIDVKLIKTDHSYQSLILNIDLDNNELVIDELYPPQGINKIEAGDTLSIRSQSSRTPISFVSRVLAREFNNGQGSWRLELPETIGRIHSRNAFRIYIENEQDIELEMYCDQQALPDVRIINLSSDGIKLHFAEACEPQLKQHKLFHDCILRLPEDVDIDCDIELRNSYNIRKPTPHIIGGGKLIVHNPQQRIKLQQYIASIQRKQRRRESRTDE